MTYSSQQEFLNVSEFALQKVKASMFCCCLMEDFGDGQNPP